MALVPEYLFPDHPYALKGLNGNDWKIGYCDQENIDGWAPNFVAGEVRRLDLSMDLSVNISEQTAAIHVIHTFPNGVEVVAKVWAIWNSGQTSWLPGLYIRMRYQSHEYTTQEIQQMGFNSDFYDFGVSPRYGIFEPGAGQTEVVCHAVIFIVAQYYPAQGTENVTAANSLQFCVFLPSTTYCLDPYPIFKAYEDQKVNVNFLFTQAGYESGSYTVTNIMTQSPPPFSITNLTAINNNAHNYGNGSNDPMYQGDKPSPEDDTSGPGGGDGEYEDKSDPIDFPDVPTGGALTSGMLKAFNIGSSALANLQGVLWNISIFDIATQFQKLVNEPMQCIVSLHCVPFLPATGASEQIKLGSFETGVSADRITENWHVVDCGTLKIEKYWGSALDYAPYTQVEIFLPFIGIRSLKIEDVIATTLHVKYYIDILTGSCIAFIKCGQSVLYTFTGSCIQHIPMMSQSSDLLKNNITAVGAVGVGLATGMSAAAVAGAAAGAINSATAKNHVQRSGDVAGSAGIMGEYEPYLILHRPKQSLAAGYNQYKGYPSNITAALSSLSGYTEIEHIHLTGIDGATDTELTEIETLLKKGVII